MQTRLDFAKKILHLLDDTLPSAPPSRNNYCLHQSGQSNILSHVHIFAFCDRINELDLYNSKNARTSTCYDNVRILAPQGTYFYHLL